MGFCPEAAPDNENHILRYTSAVREVEYQSARVVYTTDVHGSEILKLAFQPDGIRVNGRKLKQGDGISDGWFFDPETKILQLVHGARRVEIGFLTEEE